MTTHETNPYRQKVDDLLEQKAQAAERQKQARAENELRLQEIIKNGRQRLDRNIQQMQQELRRLNIPSTRLGDNWGNGWKLGDSFAIAESGQLLYFPPSPITTIKSGEPWTREWREFELETEMRGSRGVVGWSQFHEGSIKVSLPKRTGGFFEYLDEEFERVVKVALKDH